MLSILFLTLGISAVNALPARSLPPIDYAAENHPAIVDSSQLGSSITGQVFNSSHRPVERVRVELLDDNDSLLRSVITDGSGLYRFAGLSDANYQVRVQPLGTAYIQPHAQRISINNFSLGQTKGVQTVRADFLLLTREEAETGSRTGVVFAQDVPEPALKAYNDALIFLKDEKTAQQGLEGLQNAVKLFPKYFFAQARLGKEYYKRGQYEAAITALTAATVANPKSDNAFYWLGLSQLKLKKNSEASESFEHALKINAQSESAHLALGQVLYADGKLDAAETHFKQAYKVGGKRIPIVHLHLAQLYDKTKRYQEEASELERYLTEQPDDPNAEKIKKAIGNLRRKG